MKTKAFLCVLLILGGFSLFSKNTPASSSPKAAGVAPFSKLIINNLDSMIFDLASATITATYLDLPIYVKSDDVINGIDYAMKFNMAKLTYSTTSDLLPNDPTIVSLAYFNQTTLFLKYTGTSQQSFPANATYITKIRFAINTPCTMIDTSDFTNLAAYLNGVRCGFRKTKLDFSQFIPTANFNTSPPCSNTGMLHTDASTVTTGAINAWQWSFSNGGTSTQQNPSVTFTATGTEASTLIVTTAMGCKDTVVKQFPINDSPVSSFTYSFDCLKDSVIFTNSSTIPSGAIVGSLWDFGDQGVSTATNPVHHYNASGFFTVTLVSTSGFSCTSATTVQVALNNKVAANFTLTSNNQCQGSVISFSDMTTYVNPINAWNWNFGDGSTSTLQHPTHTFTASGNYSVTLTSTSTDGCKGTITQVIIIDALPTVQFAASTTSACAMVPINYNDLSTTPPGSAYLWYFGDGNTSSLQSPAHTYTAGNVYAVKLVVTTPGGCADSLTKNAYLTVHSLPVPGFSLTSACILVNISFIDTTSIAGGSITSWAWDLGNGSTSTLQHPSNTYSTAGSYTVSLTSTSDLGCVATRTRVIVLSSKPVVNFNYSNGLLNCSGQEVNFSNLSTPAIGPSYLWNFGDGLISVLQSPSHTYSAAGNYSIQLIVINPGGCSDSLTKSYVATLPAPAVPLFADSVVANAVVSFTNLSTNAVGVSWDFGDNQGSNLDDPTHTFAEAATYQVCLTAYNALDCPQSLCKDIYVGLASIVAVPSGFTPNLDNVNDVLRVRGGPFLEMRFQVFNEWGNLLFHSTSQNEGWDGNFNGEAQPVGVYEYILKGKTIDKKTVNLYGAVNLTR